MSDKKDHGGADAGVRVKPLEWAPHPAGGEQALAAGLGLYRVHKDSKNWYLVPDHMGEGGKEAAQRDYEKRILSVLSTPAPVETFIKCENCIGTGLVANNIGEPDICKECKGNTVVRSEPAPVAANVHTNSKAVFEVRRRGNVFGRFVNEKLKSASDKLSMEDNASAEQWATELPDGSVSFDAYAGWSRDQLKNRCLELIGRIEQLEESANASVEAQLRATLIVVRDMIANEMIANAVTDIKTMKPLKDVVEEALIATSMVNNAS